MSRKFVLIVVLVLCMTMVFACSAKVADTSNEAVVDKMASEVVETDVILEEITVLISGPKAPPTFPILRMIETNALGDNVNIEFKVWNGIEELLAIATGGEYGFLAVPLNVSAKLYNKGLDIKLTNVDTWGVMYLASTNPNVNKWKDLQGRKLFVPLKSAPPDIITQHYLNKYGLEIGKDIEVIYSSPAEIAQMMKAGKIENAVNIQPFITASEGGENDVRVVMDYMQEWKKLEGDNFSIPNAGITTNDKFLKAHPGIVEQFEQEYEIALAWTLDNPEEASKLVEKYLGLNATLIQNAIPTMGLSYKRSIDVSEDLEKYYNVLLEFNTESIGGKVPDENYYYQGN